jgi:hypothetical protein
MQASSNVMQAQMMEARDRVIASAGGDRVGPFETLYTRVKRGALPIFSQVLRVSHFARSSIYFR